MMLKKSDPMEGCHPDLPQYEFQQNEAKEYRWVYLGSEPIIYSPLTYAKLDDAIKNAKYDQECRQWEARRKAWKKIDLSACVASAVSATSAL